MNEVKGIYTALYSELTEVSIRLYDLTMVGCPKTGNYMSATVHFEDVELLRKDQDITIISECTHHPDHLRNSKDIAFDFKVSTDDMNCFDLYPVLLTN